MDYNKFINHVENPNKWEHSYQWERLMGGIFEKYFRNDTLYKVLRLGYDKETNNINLSIVIQKCIDDDWEDVKRIELYQFNIKEVDKIITPNVFNDIIENIHSENDL